MSGKRRANVMADYSSSEDSNDPDFEVSSSGRSTTTTRTGQRKGSIASNGSSENPGSNCTRVRTMSKRPCLNRNALLARENRQRKKEYLEKVENKLSFYKQENKNLSNMIQRQDIDLKRLKAEVSYLRSVLNNSSGITNLLKSMNDTLSGKRDRGKNNDLSLNQEQSCRDFGKRAERSLKNWKNCAPQSWKRDIGKCMKMRTTNSFGDYDHTYTREDSLNDNENIQNSEENCDSMMDDCSFDAGSLNFEISELDQLPQFDDNIFNALGNCAESIGSMEEFRHSADNINKPGNLFDNLENSGICLHVNSGKISLEFCSICHLNSINSPDE